MEQEQIVFVAGGMRGDEGKGRVVDSLAGEFDMVARAQGGNNAGHTVVLPDGEQHKLSLLPSGIAHEGIMNVIGNGVVIDPVKLVGEIDSAAEKGIDLTDNRLMISETAHLILPHHIVIDTIRESGENAQGSTKKGIAPSYSDKAMRSGVRMDSLLYDLDGFIGHAYSKMAETNMALIGKGQQPINIGATVDEYIEAAKRLRYYTYDTVRYVNEELRNGARLLAEGAQGAMLDIDHGMYPAVTSSSTTAAGVFSGLGIPPQEIYTIGVMKAVQSHVGGGPFVTEILDEAELLQLHGDEYAIDGERGTVTDRRRRLGYLDIPAMRRSDIVNDYDELVLTKLDWVPRYGKRVKVCTDYKIAARRTEISPASSYALAEANPVFTEFHTWEEDISEVRNFEDLPAEAQIYVRGVEELIGKPITQLGVGPRRDQVIHR